MSRDLSQRPPTSSELLLATRDLWTLWGEAEDEALRNRAARGAFRMLHLANVLAVTGS